MTLKQSNLGLLSPSWLAAHARADEKENKPRLRAVIYARYSTTNQDENSIERQIEASLKYIESIGAELVMPADRFVDRARSGAYMIGRDGLNDLLSKVAGNQFDIVVVEDADRLSRDLGHLGEMYRTLEYQRVQLHAAMRGRLGLAEIAMYGFLSAEQREQLKVRSRKGSILAANEGRAPKGAIFGYASAPQRHGYLVVDDATAAIVRFIYVTFDEGVPVREIARLLNADGIPSSYGKTWSAPAIRGSAKDGTGLLRNHRYKGLLVYNRTETRRHPNSAKRHLLVRPRSEWVVKQVPEWRIVDDELWDRVQERLVATSETTRTRAAPARRSKHEPLLPHAIHCRCGSRMITVTKSAVEGRRLVCESHFEKGRCTIGHSVGLKYVERNLVRMIRDRVLESGIVTLFEEEYRAECVRIEWEVALQRQELSSAIIQLDARIEKTWDEGAMAGFSNERIAAWRTAWEAELADKRQRLSRLPKTDKHLILSAGRASDLRRALTDFTARIPSSLGTVEDQRLAAAVRRLVPRVDLAFAPGGRGYTLRVEARLDELLDSADRNGCQVPVLRRIEETFGPTEWGRMADPDRRARMAALAESRVHALSDEDWTAISHCFEQVDLRAIDARSLMDAGLFHLRNDVPLSKLPSVYGNRGTVSQALKRIVRSGIWSSAIAILTDRGSRAVEGLVTTAFDHWRQ
nr:recombinase family protein [Methylobacterium sp. L1A1]